MFNDIRRLQDEDLARAGQLKPEEVMQLLGAKSASYGNAYQPSDEERALQAARMLRQRERPQDFDPVGFARFR